MQKIFLGHIPCYIYPSKNDRWIIACHGFLSRSRHLYPFIRKINKAGYGVVAFDFYGHGKNKKDINDLRLSKMIEEFRSVLGYVHKMGNSKVGVFGFSIGGYISMIGADERVESMLLLNPVIDFARVMETLRIPGDSLMFKDNLYRRFKIDAGFLSESYYFQEAQKKLKIPIKIIQGKMDKVVDPGLVHNLEKVKIEMIDSLGHIPFFHIRYLNKRICDWFNSTL